MSCATPTATTTTPTLPTGSCGNPGSHRSRTPHAMVASLDGATMACDVQSHKNFAIHTPYPTVTVDFTNAAKTGRRGHVVVAASGATCDVDVGGTVVVSGTWPRQVPVGTLLVLDYYVHATDAVLVESHLHAARAVPQVTHMAIAADGTSTSLTFDRPVFSVDAGGDMTLTIPTDAFTVDVKNAAGASVETLTTTSIVRVANTLTLNLSAFTTVIGTGYTLTALPVAGKLRGLSNCVVSSTQPQSTDVPLIVTA